MELARAAVAMARRVADRRTLLDTIRAAGSALMDLAAPAERQALDREHVRLAEELGDPAEAFRGHTRLLFDGYELADLVGAEASIEAASSASASGSNSRRGWNGLGLIDPTGSSRSAPDATATSRDTGPSNASRPRPRRFVSLMTGLRP